MKRNSIIKVEYTPKAASNSTQAQLRRYTNSIPARYSRSTLSTYHNHTLTGRFPANATGGVANSLDFSVFASRAYSVQGGCMGQRLRPLEKSSGPGPGWYNPEIKQPKQAAIFGYAPRDSSNDSLQRHTITYIDIYSRNDPVRPKSNAFTFTKSIENRNIKASKSHEGPGPGHYHCARYKPKNVPAPVFKKPISDLVMNKTNASIFYAPEYIEPHCQPKSRGSGFQRFSSVERFGSPTTRRSKYLYRKLIEKPKFATKKCEKVIENIQNAWVNNKDYERIRKINEKSRKLESAKITKERI